MCKSAQRLFNRLDLRTKFRRSSTPRSSINKIDQSPFFLWFGEDRAAEFRFVLVPTKVGRYIPSTAGCAPAHVGWALMSTWALPSLYPTLPGYRKRESEGQYRLYLQVATRSVFEPGHLHGNLQRQSLCHFGIALQASRCHQAVLPAGMIILDHRPLHILHTPADGFMQRLSFTPISLQPSTDTFRATIISQVPRRSLLSPTRHF